MENMSRGGLTLAKLRLKNNCILLFFSLFQVSLRANRKGWIHKSFTPGPRCDDDARDCFCQLALLMLCFVVEANNLLAGIVSGRSARISFWSRPCWSASSRRFEFSTLYIHIWVFLFSCLLSHRHLYVPGLVTQFPFGCCGNRNNDRRIPLRFAYYIRLAVILWSPAESCDSFDSIFFLLTFNIFLPILDTIKVKCTV